MQTSRARVCAQADGARAYAIRDWILADSESEGECLFRIPQGAWQKSLRWLMTAWLEVAIDVLQWLGTRDKAGVWVIVDGIISVNALPDLEAAMGTGM